MDINIALYQCCSVSGQTYSVLNVFARGVNVSTTGEDSTSADWPVLLRYIEESLVRVELHQHGQKHYLNCHYVIAYHSQAHCISNAQVMRG